MRNGDATDAATVAHNVREVLARIRQAAQRAGRSPDAVQLIAATKAVPVEHIRAAINAGVRILGENRLQEAQPKITALSSIGGIRWHFIGRLQRRKVKAIVGSFELLHSVDSLELAVEIDRRAREAGIQQPVLLEVNIGGETTKGGFTPDAVADAVTELDALSHVVVKGLMAIPPPTSDPEGSRPYFRRLREVAGRVISPMLRRVSMDEFSMGMTQDFEVAVEEGATMVRVGTGLFGTRDE